jgi:hypothetical protein
MAITPCAHLLFDVHGNLVRVTNDDTEASMAESEGLDVSTNATAKEVAEELGSRPPFEVMDDVCWRAAVAPALRKLADTYLLADYANPLFETTPRDLPFRLASMRLVCISEVFAPIHDLGCYVEAAEVVMATKHDRPVSAPLLGDMSLASHYFAYLDNPRDVLVDAYLTAQEHSAQLGYTQLQGQYLTDREKRDILRASQEEAELKHILDLHQEALADAG